MGGSVLGKYFDTEINLEVNYNSVYKILTKYNFWEVTEPHRTKAEGIIIYYPEPPVGQQKLGLKKKAHQILRPCP